jgi:ribosomal protein S18 acetylase RimI-like enzyme
MSLHSEASSLSIERLGPPDLVETFGYLDLDPVVNVYLLALTVRDALAQPRDEFWGVRRDGEMVGLLHLGGHSGAVLPVGDDPAAIARLAEHALARRSFLPRRFQVIGPGAAVSEIAQRLAESGIRPRLRRQQWYMAIERGRLSPFERLRELHQARPTDYEITFRTGALLRAEELDEDPRTADPVAYARRVEEECRDGYTFLWTDTEGLCFRASVSARTPDAAQISGVYVPPARRGHGFAKRGMAELCARLLEESHNVCLFVNDFNGPALAVYRRLGFTERAAWASAFYDART